MKRFSYFLSLLFPILSFLFFLVMTLPVARESERIVLSHADLFCFIAVCFFSILFLLYHLIRSGFHAPEVSQYPQKVASLWVSNLLLIFVSLFSLTLTFFENAVWTPDQIRDFVFVSVLMLLSLASYLLTRNVANEEKRISKLSIATMIGLLAFQLATAINFTMDACSNTHLTSISVLFYVISIFTFSAYLVPFIWLERADW
jgi:hypothetical protein